MRHLSCTASEGQPETEKKVVKQVLILNYLCCCFKGSSLIVLLESEASYVHFIEKNQKVRLSELAEDVKEEQVEELTERLRDLQKNDRALMEKATQAFVSHVRAYSKHECSLLLRVKVVFVQKLSL